MSGLLPFVGAGLAVAVLVLLAARLGFRGAPQLADADEVLILAKSLPGGFAATRVLVAKDRRHALLVDSSGRVALVYPHGAHFIVGLFHGAVIALPDRQSLDLGVGHALVRIEVGEERPDWIEVLHHARTQL